MWEKKGLIYVCDILGTGYASDPFIDIINEKVWRIYFTSRTKDVISLPFCIDVQAGNPKNILKVYTDPLFLPGYAGTFDEHGITPTSIIDHDNSKYLYYCGWNRGGSVPYSLSIGMIRGKDGFIRQFDGPVMSRSPYDPICVSAPFVLKEGDVFRMWYISFTEWEIVDGKLEPIFIIKTAYSFDGIKWKPVTKPCLKSKYLTESCGRPWVIKDEGIYKMWFSVRGNKEYRSKNGQHYTIGYAESNNGENFRREDAGIEVSDGGWDSEMIEYASVTKYKDHYYMLYNGNQFGKTGFGYATKKIVK
jgi:hypothetical protein